MCYPTKDEVIGSVWSLSPCPRHPSINVDPPRAHPTPLSIAGVPGEVSRQRVASFFPLLRIAGGLPPPGYAEGKEHAHAAALLSRARLYLWAGDADAAQASSPDASRPG